MLISYYVTILVWCISMLTMATLNVICLEELHGDLRMALHHTLNSLTDTELLTRLKLTGFQLKVSDYTLFR